MLYRARIAIKDVCLVLRLKFLGIVRARFLLLRERQNGSLERAIFLLHASAQVGEATQGPHETKHAHGFESWILPLRKKHFLGAVLPAAPMKGWLQITDL